MIKDKSQVLILGGNNENSVLAPEFNNKRVCGRSIISPPITSNFKVSTISSYSAYFDHSVIITEEGLIFGIGLNENHEIVKSLPHNVIGEYTKFDLRNAKRRKLHPISAFCGSDFTLYMVSMSENSGEKVTLASTFCDIKTVSPLFLNIGNKTPIAIYGGFLNSAAINNDGSLTFIPSSMETNSTSEFKTTHLPSNEAAVCLSVCASYIFAVDLRGRLFKSKIPIKDYGSVFNFSIVECLKNEKIVEVNGSFEHCFAVTEDGRVFGYGSNDDGKLGIGKSFEKLDKFSVISSLSGYKIKHAFAGYNHSLFITFEGKVLACGNNSSGQLLFSEYSNDNCYLPAETEIKSGAVFCVTGYFISAVFIGIDPKNSPNHRIDTEKLVTETTISSVLLHSSSSSEKIEYTEEEKSDDDKIQLNIKNCKKTNRKKRFYESQNRVKKSSSVSIDEVERLKAEIAAVRQENQSLRARLNENSIHKDHQFKATLEVIDQSTVSSMKRCSVVGRGAQSEVVKVTREVDFALKIMIANPTNSTTTSQEKPSDISALKRLLNEYEIITSLHHPNIIEAYGFCFGDSANPPSILLQFCPHSLQEVVCKLTDIEKVCSIYEISLGMEAIHKAGLIHRDLKPANILIDDQKHVRVSDFGVSCVESVESQTESMTSGVGTIKFMAPELLNESCYYTNKVDVYSFGVVVYFVLTEGQIPKISIAEQSSGKKAPIPQKINKVSRNLITKCWSTNPDERPSFTEIIEFIKCNKFGLIDGIEEEMKSIKKFLSI